MGAESIQCVFNSGVVEGGIYNINENTLSKSGPASAEIGKWLVEKMSSGFGSVNESISYLKDNCGYTQSDINALGTYNPKVVDSLALHGTEPTKVPFFGSYLAAAAEKAGHHVGDIYNKVASKLGFVFHEAPNYISNKVGSVMSNTGSDDSQYILAGSLAGVLLLSLYAGNKINK